MQTLTSLLNSAHQFKSVKTSLFKIEDPHKNQNLKEKKKPFYFF